MGMGSRVVSVAEIGLDLDDANHQPPSGIQTTNEAASDQIARHDPTVARVESEAQRRAQWHPSSIAESSAAARLRPARFQCRQRGAPRSGPDDPTPARSEFA